jgi:transcriptional regulator with XRE-family HTH domain
MSTGYRPPSTEPQGRWARHIHAFRKANGWSQTRGFERTREALGLSEKSRSAYIDLDIGRREPKPEEAEALASVYGWPTEEEPEPTTEPTLAAALMALAGEIRAAREERATVEARLRGLEGAVALLAQRGGVELRELVVPRD